MPTWDCAGCHERTIPDLVCMDCKVTFYCSAKCRDEDVSHKAVCYPSVPFEASASIKSRLFRSTEVSEFERENLLALGMRDTGRPFVVSSREVNIDPHNFVTTRFRIDSRKRTLLRFQAGADLRFQVTTGEGLQTTLMVPSVSKSSHLSLYQDIDMFVLIAPGQRMLADLESRRALAQGTAVRDLQVPDRDLIRYAQSLKREEQAEDVWLYIVEWYPR